MTYSPNLPISSGWKSTVQNAFQVLRRIKFLVEDDFTWTNFTPTLDFGTMAATGITIDMKTMRVANTLFFRGQISATLAAVFGSQVLISLPSNGVVTSGFFLGGSIPVLNAGVWEAGQWVLGSDSNKLRIRRGNVANYTAGLFSCILNGFIEVT